MIRIKVVSIRDAILMLFIFISIIVILLFCADALLDKVTEEREENGITNIQNTFYELPEKNVTKL